MTELFTQYAISEILIFLIIFAVAIKGFIDFFDWGINRLRKLFNKDFQNKTEKQQIYQRLEETNQKINDLAEQQKETKGDIHSILSKVEIILDSDKDDIKAWITEKHHYFIEKKWIDYQSLDTLEKRYAHYKDEGGNSYVEELMEELRKLPKQPLD